MFTVDFNPGSFDHIISPRGKFSAEFFENSTEERDHFDGVKGQFGIEVEMSECIYKEVHQSLHPTRIFVIKYVLQRLMSSGIKWLGMKKYTSKKEAQMAKVSVLMF